MLNHCQILAHIKKLASAEVTDLITVQKLVVGRSKKKFPSVSFWQEARVQRNSDSALSPMRALLSTYISQSQPPKFECSRRKRIGMGE